MSQSILLREQRRLPGGEQGERLRRTADTVITLTAPESADGLIPGDDIRA
ncbi:hypothetical protein [Micrococcus sp.]|nr:hypothetical protein [Micrococcus sp.]MDY6055452.1 hypothetical protein [Micrococcus sp.]